MTAYGRGEHQLEKVHFVAEIRSVNSRYRDVHLRIGKDLQGIEKEFKDLIASKVRRGRIEVSIQAERSSTEPAYDLELNAPLLEAYLRIFEQISEQYGIDPESLMNSLNQMQDIIVVKSRETDLEMLKPGYLGALRGALESLEVMRVREGRALELDFRKRLGRLERYADKIKERAPELVKEYRERLRRNIARMSDEIQVDENRLLQEVALFADRSDITEELVRIKSHLVQFSIYLDKNQGLGRRLDFLLQEINREVNTLSVKASDSAISKTVVEMKAEIEKLREQVQNVE
jgi:uncharacterized protein (TIGR00255 family)